MLINFTVNGARVCVCVCVGRRRLVTHAAQRAWHFTSQPTTHVTHSVTGSQPQNVDRRLVYRTMQLSRPADIMQWLSDRHSPCQSFSQHHNHQSPCSVHHTLSTDNFVASFPYFKGTCSVYVCIVTYLARSANLPEGLYILPSVVSFLFFYLLFLMISRRQIFSRSAGHPIFAIFTSNKSFLGVDDRSGPLFSISQGTLPWQQILCKNGAKLPTAPALIAMSFRNGMG